MVVDYNLSTGISKMILFMFINKEIMGRRGASVVLEYRTRVLTAKWLFWSITLEMNSWIFPNSLHGSMHYVHYESILQNCYNFGQHLFKIALGIYGHIFDNISQSSSPFVFSTKLYHPADHFNIIQHHEYSFLKVHCTLHLH